MSRIRRAALARPDEGVWAYVFWLRVYGPTCFVERSPTYFGYEKRTVSIVWNYAAERDAATKAHGFGLT